MMRLICLLSLVSAAFAQGVVVIRDVRVFDGEKLIPRATVVIRDGRIQSVSANAQIPDGAKVIDGARKTLLPGLIDAHTHTIGMDSLRQASVFGVTTTLDMFTQPDLVNGVKKQKAEGKLPDYADVFTAGYLATVPGGHGTEYGIKVPTLTSPGEAQAWVDARIAEGSDYIKLIYDDALEYGSSRATPTLSKETLKAVIDAAHKRGKLAVVHIGTLEQAEVAIQAGADGLAHLFVGPSSEPNFGKLAAQHHIFVVPTLSVLNSICKTDANAQLSKDPRLVPNLPDDAKGAMLQTFPMAVKISCAGAVEAVRQLKAEHVPILTGSDVPNPGTTQGATIHGEMALLTQAGLTPTEALVAATSAAAKAFHLDDRGRIAPGLRADLLLVNGDPTVNIGSTRDIEAVWVRGVAIDLEAWRASLVKQKKEAESKPAPAGLGSGLISDFEDGKAASPFGAGWIASTDSFMGGKSVVQFAVAPDGANGGKGAMTVTGEVREGFAAPWSGVMFSPGAVPMGPANLSSKKGFSFWAKGDGKTYRIMLFAQGRGYTPITKTFVAGPEWKQQTFTFAEFDGLDGRDIMGMVWCAGPTTGPFEFRLDDVRLQ